MFLGPCPAVPLLCPLLASKGLILSPGLTALGPALAPCYGQQGQERGWQIKTKCRSCSKQLLEEEPTAASTGLGASFMSPCLIPSKTHKPYLQGCWEEGKPLGPDWDSLVGNQADSQMKFFRLETILQFLGRFWSQGTTSIMAREEIEAVQEAGLSGMTGGSSTSSLESWNPHFDDPPEHDWTLSYLDHGGGS